MLIVTRDSLPSFTAFMKSMYNAIPLGPLDGQDVVFFCKSTTKTLTLMFDGALPTVAVQDKDWLQTLSAAWTQYRNETNSLANSSGENEDTGDRGSSTPL